jgi:hypothetical protein
VRHERRLSTTVLFHDRDLRVDGSLCASSGHSLSTTGHISSETHAAKRKVHLLDCVSRLVEHGI